MLQHFLSIFVHFFLLSFKKLVIIVEHFLKLHLIKWNFYSHSSYFKSFITFKKKIIAKKRPATRSLAINSMDYFPIYTIMSKRLEFVEVQFECIQFWCCESVIQFWLGVLRKYCSISINIQNYHKWIEFFFYVCLLISDTAIYFSNDDSPFKPHDQRSVITHFKHEFQARKRCFSIQNVSNPFKFVFRQYICFFECYLWLMVYLEFNSDHE